MKKIFLTILLIIGLTIGLTSPFWAATLSLSGTQTLSFAGVWGTNLFDQDGGSGGSGDKGAFTLADLRDAELATGSLTVDTMYEISAVTGEDFTTDGAPDNEIGTTFIATGTNVALDVDNKVYPVDISWVPYGTNTIEIDSGALLITYGSETNGATIYLRDADDFTSDLTIGKQYKLTFDTKVGATDSVLVRYCDGAAHKTIKTVTETNFTSVVCYFVAQHATTGQLYVSGMDAGEEIWLDNLVFEPQEAGLSFE